MNIHLISNNILAKVLGATVGGVVIERIATTYAQTLITVCGEILIACITGYCLIKVTQLKQHINSRMDELLRLTKDSARAEGVIEGKKEERANVAAIDKGIRDSKQKESIGQL